MTRRAPGGGVAAAAGEPGTETRSSGERPPAGERGDPEAGVTRRQFLIGGGVVVAAAAALGVVGRRSWRVRDGWYRLTGAYGEPGTPPPSYQVTYKRGTLPSKHLAGPAAYDIGFTQDVAPAGATRNPAGTPVVICLPGRNRTPDDVLEGGLHFGDYVADAIVKRGVTPFAVAAVQASDTYWHRRAAGDDAMAMLFEEFIPFLRDEHGLGGPVAIMGWSMGGYGALRAAELHPREFCAVCGVSAALWRSYDDGVAVAFDSAADYAANDVFADADALSGLPVRIDCGRQDPFYEADKAFAEALPESPAGGFSPGGHNDDFWSRVAPGEIDWLGGHLSRTAP